MTPHDRRLIHADQPFRPAEGRCGAGGAPGDLQARNAEKVSRWPRPATARDAGGSTDELAAVLQTVSAVVQGIGTPLNLISGYVQMIREREGPDSATGRRLKIIEDQVARIASALREIQRCARRPAVRVPTSPARLVERVCEIVRPRLDRANIRLDIHTPCGVADVTADSVQLELALLTVVTASLDAMPSGGTLAVTVSSAGARVHVQVGRTEGGDVPERLPRVFEPRTAAESSGLDPGLGLSIAESAVEAHGGTIDVRSAPGAGTVFTIDLPAAVPESFETC